MRISPRAFGQETILANLDKILAWGGLLAGIALLALALAGLPEHVGLAVSVMVTAGVHLLRSGWSGAGQQAWTEDSGRVSQPVQQASRHTCQARWLTGCILLLSTVAVGLSYNSLGRPAWVIVLLSAIPVCILAEVLLFSELSRELETLLLLQVVCLLAAVVLSGIYGFAHTGGDTWLHALNASLVADSGTLAAIREAYINYPLYPAVLAALSKLTVSDPEEVAQLFDLAGALIALLALYGLARTFYTAKESLVLAILLVGSKWFVYWSTLAIPMSTALWLFILCASLALKRLSARPRAPAILALVAFVAAVPFFHPVGATAVVMLFLGLSVLDAIQLREQGAGFRRSLIGLSMLAIVITLGQWMFYGDTLGAALPGLGRNIAGIDQPQLIPSTADTTVYNLDQINPYILYVLAGLGILRGLELRRSDLIVYAGLTGLGFALFGYLMMFLTIQGALGHRWMLFASLLLVLPGAWTLSRLVSHRSSLVKVLVLLGITLYFVSGLGTTVTNPGKPLYGKDSASLVRVTDAEYSGLLYLQELTDMDLNTDLALCHYLNRHFPRDRLYCWRNMEFAYMTGLITYRDAYLDRMWLAGRELSSQDLAFREETDVTLLYDSGKLKIYDRVPTLGYGPD